MPYLEFTAKPHQTVTAFGFFRLLGCQLARCEVAKPVPRHEQWKGPRRWNEAISRDFNIFQQEESH